MHYQKGKQTFLKIYVSHPKYVSQLRTTIEGIARQNWGVWTDILSETTFESNLPYALRFMVDNDIGGMTWIRIEKGGWCIRHDRKKETHC